MAHLASTKGASFVHTWEELRGLIDAELISRDELEVRLGVEALAILDEKIEPDLEYPLDAVDEIARLVVELRERERHRATTEPLPWPSPTAAGAEIIREYLPDQDAPALSDLWRRVFGVTKGGQTVVSLLADALAIASEPDTPPDIPPEIDGTACEQLDQCSAVVVENLCLGEIACIEGKCQPDPAPAVVCDPATSHPCRANVCEPTTGVCGEVAENIRKNGRSRCRSMNRTAWPVHRSVR